MNFLLRPQPNKPRNSFIKAFKGLESPAVILTDIAGFSPGFTKQEFYVACTRARFRLIIIPTSKGEPMLRELCFNGKQGCSILHSPT